MITRDHTTLATVPAHRDLSDIETHATTRMNEYLLTRSSSLLEITQSIQDRAAQHAKNISESTDAQERIAVGVLHENVVRTQSRDHREVSRLMAEVSHLGRSKCWHAKTHRFPAASPSTTPAQHKLLSSLFDIRDRINKRLQHSSSSEDASSSSLSLPDQHHLHLLNALLPRTVSTPISMSHVIYSLIF